MVEYAMIIEALTVHNGPVTDAARDLGLMRRMLG
jgi:transcriptional regulator of acetoin/glycerol metabolism